MELVVFKALEIGLTIVALAFLLFVIYGLVQDWRGK